MGNNENENNELIKDMKRPLKRELTEKSLKWSEKKLHGYISNSYRKKEISFVEKELANEVPKALSLAGKGVKVYGITQDVINYKTALKKEGIFQATISDGGAIFAETRAPIVGSVVGPLWNNMSDKVINFMRNMPTLTPKQMSNFRHAKGKTRSQSTLIETVKQSQSQQISKEWRRYLNNINNYDDTAKFKKLEPAKYDSSNKPIAGVANSQGTIDKTELLVSYPQPVVSEKPLGWLGQLGSILSETASLISQGFNLASGIGATSATTGATGQFGTTMGGQTLKSGSFLIKHTGGVVVPSKKGGRNEMLAILQGGETVRTEAQEKELQDAKMKEFLDAYAPLVSGENDENNPYAQVFGNNKSQKKDSKIPVLANKTTHDEEMIIAIIADAWKSNRSGFRNVLRYN